MPKQEKSKIEKDFISLLLQSRALVDVWVDSGPQIEFFDEDYRPILTSIRMAYNQNSLLTRRHFVSILRDGPLKKVDIVAQEGMFNRINANISNVNGDDFNHLKKQIVEEYIKQNVVSYIDRYRDDLKTKGGMYSVNKLSSRLADLVDLNEEEKRAIYEDAFDYAPVYIKMLEEKAKRGDEDIVTCGIKEIDYSMVVGFSPGSLTLFCGDVGAFKSAMMANVGINIWKNKKRNVLVVPLEMPRDKWYQRVVSRETSIAFDRLEHSSMLTDEEWTKVRNMHKAWGSWEHRLYIMEAPERVSVSYIRREVERHIEIFKPDVVVIDYIANLTPSKGSKVERSDLQIGEMLKDLRQMGRPGGMGICPNGFATISGAQIGRDALKRVRKLGTAKTGFYSEDLRNSQEYAADSDNIYAQIPDPNNKERLYFYCVKTRYGKGLFPNGSSRSTLEVNGSIGLIKSESNDWVDKIKKDEILKKVDEPISKDEIVDGDMPWANVDDDLGI